MLPEERRLDLPHRLLVAFDVLHARVHVRHLAVHERLAFARDEGGDGYVGLPVHPAQGVVLVVEAEVLLLAHAHHQVTGAVDRDRLAERIVAAEELRGALAAEHDDARRAGHVGVGDEAPAADMHVVHRAVGRNDPHHLARLLDAPVADGHSLRRHRRDEVDVGTAFLDGHGIRVGETLRSQRLGAERDLSRILVPDPDLLDAAADAVVLHRGGLAGHGEREGRHNGGGSQDDPQSWSIVRPK